jgi:CHASE3 domain sensor protein
VEGLPLITDFGNSKAMRAVSLVCTAVVFSIGALVLAGWALGNETLKTVLPGLVAMKPNTAVGLMLSSFGLALPCLIRPGKWTRVFLILVAVMVGAIGAITLSEYFFGWNFRFDQWLFTEPPGTVWTMHPGRMAPISAFCFVMLGGAIIAGAMHFAIWIRTPFLAGTGIAFVVTGVVALIGCIAEGVFHAPSWNDSGLALHTAFAFLLLGVAALARANMLQAIRWWLDRSVTAGISAAIAVMILAASASYDFAYQLLQTLASVSHRQEVIREISVAGGGNSTLESALRAYIITADPALIQDRPQTIDGIHAAIADLRKLTADEPAQQQRLDQLEKAIAARIDFGDRTIALRNSVGYQVTEQLASANAGTLPNNEVTTLIHALRDNEYALLDQERQSSKDASTRTLLVLPLGVFLSLTIACMGLLFHNAGVGERTRIEVAFKESEERFESVVETMSEGLVVSNMQGELIHWNPAALAMHGFASDIELRKSLPHFVNIFELSTIDGEVLPVDRWPMARILRGERVRKELIRIRSIAGGWEKIFTFSGETVRRPGEDRVGYVVVLPRDIEALPAENGEHMARA